MKIQYKDGKLADVNGNSMLSNIVWNSFSKDELMKTRNRLMGELNTINTILLGKCGVVVSSKTLEGDPSGLHYADRLQR